MSYTNRNIFVDEIGIDIDTKKWLPNLFVQINAKNLGKVHSYETNKGYHYRIKLKQKIYINDAIKLRYYLGDDVNRIHMDLLRLRSGLTIFDVLFTHKKTIKKGP
jgi:hypothetical protein